MGDIERMHHLTDAIQKNILDNYYPGVKQLISTGRALQKSLHGVVNASKAYIDSIYGIAKSAQSCKGATTEVGAALVQIAEVHKEINTQVLDNIKTFHTELLIPLESSQDNGLKKMQVMHKKYLSGHKYHLSPYAKALAAQKKNKKKYKNKYNGYDKNEAKCKREVAECHAKLDEYHTHELREALLEERKKYCSVLEKVCTVVRNYATHHSKAHELLTHRLYDWSSLCQDQHVLPHASEMVVQAYKNNTPDDMYSTTDEIQDMRRRASLDYGRVSNSDSNTGSNQDSDSMHYNTSNRLQSTPEPSYPSTLVPNGTTLTTQDDYAVAGLQRSITFHDTPSPLGRPKVRALYSHQAADDNQLSFQEGEVISLLGEQRDGWQYGELNRTHRMGWFPISFTEPLQTGSADAHVSVLPSMGLSGRVKSLGNLREVTDEDYHHRVAAPNNVGYSDSDSGHGVDISGGKGDSRPHSTILYQQPNVRPQNKFGNQDSSVNSMRTPSPPLPPPPTAFSHHNLSTMAGNSPKTPTPPPPPPPFNTQPYQHHQAHSSSPPSQTAPTPPVTAPMPHKLYHANTTPSIPTHPKPHLAHLQQSLTSAPVPMYEYHPRNAGNHGNVNQPVGHIYQQVNNHLNHYQQPHSRYSPANSSSGYSSNAGYNNSNANQSNNALQQYRAYSPADKLPPPPSNLPPPPPSTISDSEERRNNPFSAVRLRKAQTNDRSAPRV